MKLCDASYFKSISFSDALLAELLITLQCEMYNKAQIVLQINVLPLMFLINEFFR